MPSVGSGRSAGAAGKRDRYVLIQAAQPVQQSAAGQPNEPFAPLRSVWMSRTDLSGGERFTSDQETASQQTGWVMPYAPDMDPELVDVTQARRLSYGGRDYDILAATPLGWHRDIELITLARTG